MVTIQNLYNNIKGFVHQKFEYKEEEDTILPQTIESFFQYIQGALNISNSTQTVNIGPNDGDGEELEGAIIIDSEITHTLLYENLVTLIHKYFYKTEEKPEKYYEWLTSEYVNGVWYICEENIPPIPTVLDMEWEIFNEDHYSNYLYFTIKAAIDIPYEMYNNIELNTTDLPSLEYYDDSSTMISVVATQSFPNSYTIICTIPTTTIDNNIYVGCQIIWTGNELIIQ